MNKIFLLMILALSSCSYRNVKEEYASELSESNGNSHFEQSTNITYSNINKNILIPKCIKCHSDFGGNQGGLNLEKYDDVVRAISSIKQRSLVEKNMPPNRALSIDEQNYLNAWISNGVPLDSKSGSLKVEETKVKVAWSQIKNDIFANKCIQCHSPPVDNPTPDNVTTMEAGLNLNDYEMVKAKADIILKRIIINDDMPLRPYQPLSVLEKKLIVDWMMQGMINDEVIISKEEVNEVEK